MCMTTSRNMCINTYKQYMNMYKLYMNMYKLYMNAYKLYIYEHVQTVHEHKHITHEPLNLYLNTEQVHEHLRKQGYENRRMKKTLDKK